LIDGALNSGLSGGFQIHNTPMGLSLRCHAKTSREILRQSPATPKLSMWITAARDPAILRANAMKIRITGDMAARKLPFV